MARTIRRHYRDLADFEEVTRGVAVSTGEVSRTWAEAELNVPSNLVIRDERRSNPGEARVVETTYALQVPADTLINGSPLSATEHRVSAIRLADGTVEAGPFTIREVVPRRDYRRRVRLVALRLEWRSQEGG